MMAVLPFLGTVVEAALRRRDVCIGASLSKLLCVLASQDPHRVRRAVLRVVFVVGPVAAVAAVVAAAVFAAFAAVHRLLAMQ